MPRPKTPLLSPELIADAALDLIDETGDLQMVILARRLKVAPGSLYNHVKGRADVVELVRLRIADQVSPPLQARDWKVAVAGFLKSFADLYARHPKALSLMYDHTISSERMLSFYEPVFAALMRAGFPASELRTIMTLIDYQAVALARGLPEPVVTDEIRDSLPAYAASIEYATNSRDEAVALATDVLISGLEQRLLRNPNGTTSQGT
ncbi:TetR/AcrR family transcriptional regulator [Kineosporia babensis]|uniref:TetR/AcrR family transcriptional regulator n=1 Tax=Kineosporia babensis TaxID=499548 RepID=A0A9X1NMS1_9ACTN|nr:TetR/AcrR family transcriptional regulator [Kineosporia babensis]MCD5316619.1 TetR/AcrR family transcriptional regulator [Kineosporia babensis]